MSASFSQGSHSFRSKSWGENDLIEAYLPVDPMHISTIALENISDAGLNPAKFKKMFGETLNNWNVLTVGTIRR